jgi:hypothetical protein
MTSSAYAVRDWLVEHHRDVITCPYQPGQLVISNEACTKRHLVARETCFDDLMKVDLFTYTLKKGLILCRGCPIGGRLASRSQIWRLGGQTLNATLGEQEARSP